MSKKSTKSLQDQLIDKLADICEELGLVIGIPSEPQDGVLLGTETFVATIVAACRGDYDTMGATEDGELIELLPIGKRDDDPTYH
jgi:hypothetical protein